MEETELLVLLHGYMRTALDMRKMKQHLKAPGRNIFAPTLPTTFKTVKDCTVELEKLMKKIPAGDYKCIHFVGHSMGGLIIRRFLSRNHLSNPGRCVLIGTPNGGSDLAVKVMKAAKLVSRISPSLNDFIPGRAMAPPLNSPLPEWGVIAGDESTFFPGSLIKEKNDGRVAVSSVAFSGMKELTVVPFRHTRIHKQHCVARLTDTFLKTGRFEADIT